MYRPVALVVSAILVLGLAACSSTDNSGSDTPDKQSNAEALITDTPSDSSGGNEVKPMVRLPHDSLGATSLTQRGSISLIALLEKVEILPWDNDLDLQEDGKIAFKVTGTFEWDDHLANQDVVVTDLGTSWVVSDSSGTEYPVVKDSEGSPVYLLPSNLETVNIFVRGNADATEDMGTADEVTTRLDLVETNAAEISLKP